MLRRLGLGERGPRRRRRHAGLAGARALRPDLGDGGGRRVPEPLLAQLADGGMLVIPVGGRDVQTLQAIRRSPVP